MTTQTKQAKDPETEKLEAEIGEAEARLRIVGAQVEARKAKEDMDRVSGLTALKDKVRKEIADMSGQAKADALTTKLVVQGQLKEIKAGLKRLGEDYQAWDAAAERRFDARLDEAEARLDAWKAHVEHKRAEHGMERHDELETLKEKIAIARARAAEARHAKYSAKAQAALDEAVDHFGEAYEAAAKRYDKK